MQHELKTTIGDGLPVEVVFDTWPEGELEIIGVLVRPYSFPVENNIRDELSEQCIKHIELVCESQLESDQQEALEIAYRRNDEGN